jgi:putative membrane protein
MKKENIMKIVIFAVVLLIPLIYSFFYLKSYWDPYGDLTGMKIAVVNLDEGENEENQGKEFVEGLKESGTFDICEVTQEEASEGMKNGDYYATITIPSNFTSCLNSASTTDKQIAEITYSPNQASNYLATQIINSAVKTMEINLQAKVDSAIVDTLAKKLEGVPDSLQEIADGADEILAGSKSLSSGLSQINDGTTTLNDSYTEFDDGIETAYEGSKALENGIKQVNAGVTSLSTGADTIDTAMTQINTGIDTLATQGTAGIATLTQGISSLESGAKQVSNGVSSVSTSLNSELTASQSKLLEQAGVTSIAGLNAVISNYNNKIVTLVTAMNTYGASTVDPTSTSGQTFEQEYNAVISGLASLNQVKGAYNALEEAKTSITTSATSGSLAKLAAGAKQVSDGASQLNSEQTVSSLTALTTGVQSLQGALEQVQGGTSALKAGVTTLSKGTSALEDGSKTLTTGLATLSSSSKTVKTALETLNDGTRTAYDGSIQLVNGIQTFKNEINRGITETNEQLEALDGIADFAENPVEFKTEAYGEVSSYGVAFTPLFLCIGLWVGALMSYVVLYFDQKNRFGKFGSDAKNKLLQNVLYLAVGAIQGIVTGALLKIGLGYEVENIALYYFASILIGITFTSIIQFLIRNFGDIGKFIALIILVLQLAAAGGTFPVETISKGFQAITPYLPMTYSIKLLREILVPTATNFKGQYIGILMGITVATLAITYIVDIIRNKKIKSN